MAESIDRAFIKQYERRIAEVFRNEGMRERVFRPKTMRERLRRRMLCIVRRLERWLISS